MAEIIGKTQAEQLQQFRSTLGESTFQRVQREVWEKFSPKAPPIDGEGNLAPLALFGIWDELIQSLEDAMKRQALEKEAANGISTNGPLWELLKNGVKWSAILSFRSRPHGWEVVITRNGKRSRVQAFLSRQMAEAWADKQCLEIAKGWKP